MPTLILPPRYTPDSIALWKAAIAQGWEVERLQSWKPSARHPRKDLVLYGEPLFVAAVADALSLIMLQPPPDWLANLPTVYLKRRVKYTNLLEARKCQKPSFIKPAFDKCFAAGVYDSGSQLPPSELLPDDLPVLISEPVVWEVEYRCFIKDGKVITISPYWRNGCLAVDSDGNWTASASEMEQAWEFCTTVLKDPAVFLPRAVVVDVGKIVGLGWAVVESNAAWGSGIYGCDRAAVLSVIEKACVSREQLTPK